MVWVVPGVLEPAEHAEKTWGVRVPAQRSEPETAAPCRHLGNRREWELASLLGSDPRQEDKGSWQGWSEIPGTRPTNHQTLPSVGLKQKNLQAGRREVQVPTAGVCQELAVWPRMTPTLMPMS